MISLQGTKSALAPGLQASFLASGGTGPYTYSVSGRGVIDPVTGLYTAPATVADTSPFFDTVTAIDSLGATASAQIVTCNPWMLLIEIIQRTLNLDKQMIWFENQKFFEPENALAGMWVVLMFPSLKAFSSGLHPVGTPTGNNGPGWDVTEKFANFSGPVDIHIMSRDLSALNRKEEVVMALTGPYARNQQEANSFYIARLPHNIIDLSVQDGDSIPWHFVLTVEMQYATTRTFSPDYYTAFNDSIVVNQ